MADSASSSSGVQPALAHEPSVATLAASMIEWLERNEGDYRGVRASCNDGATEAQVEAANAKLASLAPGLSLPPQLIELSQVFNGQHADEGIPEFPCAPWSRFLPVEDIVATWQALPDIVRACADEFCLDVPVPGITHSLSIANAGAGAGPYGYQIPAGLQPGKGGAPSLAYSSRWLPFAEAYNGEGGPPVLWLLDLDPPTTGGGGAPPVVVPHGRVIGFGGEGDSLGIWALSLAELLADVVRVMHRRSPPPPPPPPQGAPAGGASQEEQGGEAQAHGQGSSSGGRHRKVLWDDGPRVWYPYLGYAGEE